MSLPALELSSFGAAFGEKVILRSLNIKVHSPGMTVLMGPVGAGKSTLLTALAGIEDAQFGLVTWGSIWIEGAPIPSNAHRGDRRRLRRPNLVAQHAQFCQGTVRQNLVSALPDGLANDACKQTIRIVESLARYGGSELIDCLDQDAATLPLWQQRRLSVFRSLLDEPRILLVDEPTAGLQPEGATVVLELLRDQSRVRAVCLATHDPSVARRAGGQLLLFADGCVYAENDANTAPPNGCANGAGQLVERTKEKHR